MAVWSAPYVVTTGEIMTASIWNTYVTENLKAAGEGPWTVQIVPFNTSVDQSGWNTLFQHSNSIFSAVLKTDDAAIGHYVCWDVALIPGTWTFELVHNRDSGKGIYSVYHDAAVIGSIDGYNAGIDNARRDTIAGIAITASTKFRLKLALNSKNASSTGYEGRISLITYYRTA